VEQKKDVKKFKKTIVSGGILEKKNWISNISIFLKRIHNFPQCFDKISTQHNKTPHKSSISNISILKKINSTIFQNSFIKSLIHTIKYHKNLHNFFTSMDSEREKNMSKT